MLYSCLDVFASDHAARQLWIDAEEAEAVEQVLSLIEPPVKAAARRGARARTRASMASSSAADGFWSRGSLVSSAEAIGQVIIGLARRFQGLPRGQIAGKSRRLCVDWTGRGIRPSFSLSLFLLFVTLLAVLCSVPTATARGVVQRCSLQCARAICKQAERRMDECVADGFASEDRVCEVLGRGEMQKAHSSLLKWNGLVAWLIRLP